MNQLTENKIQFTSVNFESRQIHRKNGRFSPSPMTILIALHAIQGKKFNADKNYPKKYPQKVKVCEFYIRGNCTRGNKCNFSHNVGDTRCKFNVCTNIKCPFNHF